MDFFSNLDPNVMTFVVYPLFIFLARITDQTIGTMRIIFLSRGRRVLAPLLGFVETLIWIVMISQIIKNVSHPIGYVAYAAGFASGNFVGMLLEEKLAIGMLALRIITARPAREMVEGLAQAGFGVTSINAEGTATRVKIIYTVLPRKELKRAVAIVRQVNPKAFYSVEEIRSAVEGVFPDPGQRKMFWRQSKK